MKRPRDLDPETTTGFGPRRPPEPLKKDRKGKTPRPGKEDEKQPPAEPIRPQEEIAW